MIILLMTIISVCLVWIYVGVVAYNEEKRSKQVRRANLYGYTNNTKPNLEDDNTGGIDEVSNASFTDVVKEVVSDLTGIGFENPDDPISGDDDDDPIKFK